MNYRAIIEGHLTASAAIKQAMIDACSDDLAAAARCLIEALQAGHKILFCGNGGSAADSQHLAAELVARFMVNRKSLPAVALTTDTSFLTAWSNDMDFETVFSRQVEGLGQAGDVLVAITTSGNSPNVLAAVKQAQSQGLKIVVFTGETGGKATNIISADDILIHIPSHDTQRIQEGHITAGHILCDLVERALFPQQS